MVGVMNDRGGRSDLVSDLNRLADRYADLAVMTARPRLGLQRAADQLRYIANGVQSGTLDLRTGETWVQAGRAQYDALTLTPEAAP